MQTSDHMDFGDPKRKSFFDSANDFLNRIFESVGIAFFGSKRAELARKDANVGVIDVTVVDVTRVIPIFSFAHDIRHHAQRIKFARFIQSERVDVADAFLGFDFLCNGPKRVGN
jgi:hypothetical protein